MVATIIFFIIIIGLLITSHEFGHYIVGTLCGARVNEFTVGFGPKLFSFYKGDTLFCVRLLPFGGACIFDGAEGLFEGEELDEHALPNLPPAKRAATMIAGPCANFILSFLLALILVGFTGVDLPVIDSIIEGSAAEEAGLMPGDMIKKIDGEHVHMYREVSLISSMYDSGKAMTIEYVRDGEKGSVTLVPRYSEEDGRYYIGFRGGSTSMKCNPLQIFQYAAYEVQYWMRYTVKSLGMLFTGRIGIDSLSGPVGMADMVNETYEEVKPYGIGSIVLTMMNLLLLLSINVGVINLLPLPAFDGGKLIFALIELVTGHRVPPQKEAIVHLVGTVLVVALMVVVMYHDIARLFG